MMQQYHDAKAMCGDALLFFRMGDFYELFHDDAKIAARVLGLTLTSRDKSANPIPMAGFPHHQSDSYLAKLIRQGYRVAICEQVEDPKQAKGLVKREVTRVVTPGTLTEDGLLDPNARNFLAATVHGQPLTRSGTPCVGLAWVELSTGQFFATSIPASQLGDEIGRIQPAECLVAENDPARPEAHDDQMVITRRPGWAFGMDEATQTLTRHFQTRGLEGFGFHPTDEPEAIRAAGAIIDYLKETQKSSLAHIDRLIPQATGQQLEIDQATRRSLELNRTLRDGQRAGSLLAVLDRTVTAMGSRMLGDWISAPLTDLPTIHARLDAVGELLSDRRLGLALQQDLKEVHDMQRLLTRVTTGRASPRDLQFIGRTLARLPQIKTRMANVSSQRLGTLQQAIDLCPSLRTELEAALVDDCPPTSSEGGIIRQGYHTQLDQLRDLAKGGKTWIAQYQAAEQERTGIPSLKVGFNRVFGFYMEVTNAHKDKVPPEYIRKQTLKNAERYITPELKEYEEKVLTAEEQAKTIEQDLFLKLRAEVQEAALRLRSTAIALAELDVLTGLADLAEARGYCRPELLSEPHLEIRGGRHPVLDIIEPDGTFVPNDTLAGPDGFLLLITGPNMAGKSTYIRQVALITIMAQIGSYVPAESAKLGIADRVFARVGASDELSRGQSTFMVEMLETARILNTATRHSLVILDEVGRGTSTYDGVSLAWSIVEHLHDAIGCRSLFATHYHELTDLEQTHPGIANLNVAVEEWQGKVVFLHKIVPGSADKSYGIHVAQLAGIPQTVTERATDILKHLESQSVGSDASSPSGPTKKRTTRPRIRKTRPSSEFQMTLFEMAENPVIEEIRKFPVENSAPLAALQQIQQWQEALARESPSKPS